MYQYGIKPKQHRSRRPIWIGFGLLVLLVIGGMVVAKHYLKPHTSVTQAQAVVRKVTAGTAAVKGFDEPGFELALPSDWKLMEHIDHPYNRYVFQGTTPADRSRILEVYQDTIPANYMVNRIQPVEANDDKITVLGAVSDNCSDFTKGPPALGQNGTLAKWQGVEFLCDLNNPLRNVVGTSSLAGLNKVTLKGATGTSHSFFFDYTDHSISPDYSTFNSALSSFVSK